LITPAIRSDGAIRRFVVHTAHETRDQGRVVRAVSFHEAALAYAEAWRPIPDAGGTIRLSLTDLDSGEQQDATIDVARPGVTDLQARRARLELRAAARTEPPPGAERFRLDAVEPLVIATAKPQPRDYRQLAMNAAALLAVLIVSFLVVNRFARDRFTEAPWQEPGAVAQQPAPRLTAAAALLRPPAQPSSAPVAAPAAPAAGQPAGYVAPRQASRRTTVRNIPMDQLGPPPPNVSVTQPLEIPPAEAVGAATPAASASPPEGPAEPLIVRRSGEGGALGSPGRPEGTPSDDLTDRLNQALEAPSTP
jgi:hypothetical protein